jgi:hypothetical protein
MGQSRKGPVGLHPLDLSIDQVQVIEIAPGFPWLLAPHGLATHPQPVAREGAKAAVADPGEIQRGNGRRSVQPVRRRQRGRERIHFEQDFGLHGSPFLDWAMLGRQPSLEVLETPAKLAPAFIEVLARPTDLHPPGLLFLAYRDFLPMDHGPDDATEGAQRVADLGHEGWVIGRGCPSQRRPRPDVPDLHFIMRFFRSPLAKCCVSQAGLGTGAARTFGHGHDE